MSNKIYVACLASYNAAILHGEWIEVTEDKEEVMQEINAMLARSTEPYAEEWAIHDHEGFDGIDISESHDIGELCNYVAVINSCEYDIELIAGVMDNLGCNIEDAISYIEDHYQGEFPSVLDWAYHIIEEMGYLDNVPEQLIYYFDYKAYARDAEIQDIFTVPSKDGVYVLLNN